MINFRKLLAENLPASLKTSLGAIVQGEKVAAIPTNPQHELNRSLTIRFITNRKPVEDQGTLFGPDRERSVDFHCGEIEVPLTTNINDMRWDELFSKKITGEESKDELMIT